MCFIQLSLLTISTRWIREQNTDSLEICRILFEVLDVLNTLKFESHTAANYLCLLWNEVRCCDQSDETQTYDIISRQSIGTDWDLS